MQLMVSNHIKKKKMKTEIIRYRIIDSRTGLCVGTYRNKLRARRRADRLDLMYGAIRYQVRTERF